MADSGQRQTSTKRRLQAVALAAAATLFSLGVIEASLRALGLPSEAPWVKSFKRPDFLLMCFDSNASGSLDIDLNDALQRARYESRFADDEFTDHWRHTPYAVEMRFNSKGYREDEFVAKRPGVRRIVVIGDSFTVGYGLPESASYPRRLESILKARPEAGPTEVLNLGMGGFNLESIVGVADFALRDLSPVVLVYGYFMNDPVFNGDVGRPEGHDVVEVSGTRVAFLPPPVEGLHLAALFQQAVWRYGSADAFFAWHRRLHTPEYWAPSAALIAQMASRARAQDVRFVLLLLPLIWQLEDHPLREVHERITRFAHAQGIETIDALSFLSAHKAEDLILHPRDRHPNTLYTQIVAEALADKLGDTRPTPVQPGQ
jgi:hypothetical protein